MPETHDYTRPTWGHDYSISSVIDGGMKLRAAGWGRVFVMHNVRAEPPP